MTSLMSSTFPGRVVEQHKSIFTVAGESSLANIDLQRFMPDMVVGDWILVDDSNR